jgi:hypothetical protein
MSKGFIGLDKNANSEKNYELRPKFNAKFTKEKVYGIIKSILDEKMEYFQGEYDHQKALELNKRIVDDVKEQLGSGKLNIDRYKIIVHCIIGQKQGQGLKMGSKCIWDSSSDSAITASWENEQTYAYCTAYGIYYY